MQPGLDYFEKQFNLTQGTLSAFKAAHYFSPPKINDIQPNAAAINLLKTLPFLNSEAILNGLKGNFHPILQRYLTLTQALTFFSSGAKMNQVYHAGQLQLAKC